MAADRPRLKRIVIPTDYSDCAGLAFDWALFLAHQLGAEVTVVHVVERHLHFAPGGYDEGPGPADVESDRTHLEAYVAERLGGRGIRVECRVAVGEPALRIREAARDLGADLIVMGTHGKSGLEDLLFGSVTEKVVHHTGCPVLVVPPRVEAE